MKIQTDTPQLKKLRQQILELILSEHPSSCLICSEKKECDDYKSTIRKVGETTGCVLCPNNGRCELQDVVETLEIENVHFPALYRDFEVKKKDPFSTATITFVFSADDVCGCVMKSGEHLPFHLCIEGRMK